MIKKIKICLISFTRLQQSLEMERWWEQGRWKLLSLQMQVRSSGKTQLCGKHLKDPLISFSGKFTDDMLE